MRRRWFAAGSAKTGSDCALALAQRQLSKETSLLANLAMNEQMNTSNVTTHLKAIATHSHATQSLKKHTEITFAH